MDREILFKAKQKNHVNLPTDEWWVEGYLVKYGWTGKERWYIVPGYASDLYAIEIDQETICQYTGLTDKNGNKIWENDIVNKVDCNALGWHRERICRVLWCESGYWGLLTIFGDGYFIGEYESEQLEVIGNIFDNPELMDN